MEPGQVVLPAGKSEEELKQVVSVSMTSSPSDWQSQFLQLKLDSSWDPEEFQG